MVKPTRIKVFSLKRTCLAVPSQWEGTTESGRDVYIRYRHGALRVDVDRETVYKETLGDPLDGVMEYQDLKRHLADILDLPQREAYYEDWEANWGPPLEG